MQFSPFSYFLILNIRREFDETLKRFATIFITILIPPLLIYRLSTILPLLPEIIPVNNHTITIISCRMEKYEKKKSASFIIGDEPYFIVSIVTPHPHKVDPHEQEERQETMIVSWYSTGT